MAESDLCPKLIPAPLMKNHYVSPGVISSLVKIINPVDRQRDFPSQYISHKGHSEGIKQCQPSLKGQT